MASKVQNIKVLKVEAPKSHKVKFVRADGTVMEIYTTLEDDVKKGVIKCELDSSNHIIYAALRASGKVIVEYVDQAGQKFKKNFGDSTNFF